MNCAWVYIITNKHHTMLYIGYSTNLPTRLWEHRSKRNPKCFTARYNIYKLVYYERFQWIAMAKKRERYMKGKVRKWKNDLITRFNPDWIDLTDRVTC